MASAAGGLSAGDNATERANETPIVYIDGVAEANPQYAARLSERSAALAREERRFALISHLRLAVAILFVLLAAFAFRRNISGWWLLSPIVMFAVLVRIHERIARQRDRCARAVAFYRRGLARMEDRWAGEGATGERFRDPAHPYAADLDLFGDGSLFQLLTTARTPMGEEMLAKWLLAAADRATIESRQAAVAELRDRSELREDAATLGEAERAEIRVDKVSAWAEQAPVLRGFALRWLASAVAVSCIATAVAWGLTGDPLPFFAAAFVGAAISFRLRSRMDDIVAAVEIVTHDLRLIADLLARLEREEFGGERLRQVVAALRSEHGQASRAIARLVRLAGLAEHRHNLFIQALDPVILYSVQVSYAIENWRRRHGVGVRGWLAALAEFEALESLATYSHEHPQDPFPQIAQDGTRMAGEELGHPLIAAAACVRNSVALASETRVLLVSGSNMSGKSTLLRVVGVNAVLALAGAPVRARSLTVSVLQVGACMRVLDSLQKGTSHFFAEITRLRALVDLAAQRPMLFLLDELLHGTNSSDRNAGAEGLIRGLLERGAIGLVTTHDLTLTALAGEFGAAVRNVHFQDRLEGGKISFDYRLREGVVTRSNGVELMRAIGLLR